MKYIVERTSNHCSFDELNPPVENAEIKYIHRYDIRTPIIKQNGKEHLWKQFVECNRDIVQLPNGYWRGTEKEAEQVWVVEINNLNSFVDKYGDCILSKPNCEEGYYGIEIYDGYRE